MDKNVKILLIICFALVICLGVSVGYIFQVNSAQENKSVDPNINQTNITNKSQENVTKNNSTPKTTNSSLILYQGQQYKLYTKELEALGPHEVVCPVCGGDATQVGSSTKGKYWYYYYHCGICGANIAQKA